MPSSQSTSSTSWFTSALGSVEEWNLTLDPRPDFVNFTTVQDGDDKEHDDDSLRAKEQSELLAELGHGVRGVARL